MMEEENKVSEDTLEKPDSCVDDSMAPQDSEGLVEENDIGQIDQKENKDPMLVNNKVVETHDEPTEIEKKVEQITMPANEGELGEDAEDGEILEDGEIASDDGELNDEGMGKFNLIPF